MIEVGKPVHKRMTYADAVLWCFCLGDGWRMPSEDEREYLSIEYRYTCWFENSWLKHDKYEFNTVPVRDIEPTIINRILCIFHSRFFARPKR